ncbi:MAG: Gfo/Idh/MocA family oxidoreductase [Acidimicrobiales bacterium]|nr:Gfo/Idh/MocA family oxidoreductase [Acidimicrobiales bacterium]
MTFRWALAGHGHISSTFRDALAAVPGAELVAVAGRDTNRVKAYAEAHAIPKHYVSTADMLDAGGIDAVYVCTPHPAHLDAALASVGTKIPVLVEKPMTPAAGTTGQLVDAARGAGVFAMEAMWTRFLPAYLSVREWIDQGRIGDVQLLTASFGFRAELDAEHRLFSPALAGGGLLDVGVYPLALAQWLYASAPETVVATGVVGETGVDEHVVVSARYPGGLAQFGCAVRANLDTCAVVRGTEGHIEIPAFWSAQSATLHRGDTIETSSHPHRVNGFEHQIEEVMACVREGKAESDKMPLGQSLELAEVCDQIRNQLGVTYPFETQ